MDKMKLIAIGALVVCFAIQMSVDANGGRRYGQQAQKPEQTKTAEQGKREHRHHEHRQHEHRRQGKQGERRGQYGKRKGQCKGGSCKMKEQPAQPANIKPLQSATVAPSTEII